MIYNVGTDILKIDRIKTILDSNDSSFVKNVFTKNELNLILTRDNPLFSFATRFAGKEAVFKSLNCNSDCIRLSDIEILENEVGAPVVNLLNDAHKHCKEIGIDQIMISLSYDGDYAIAYAISTIK